MGSIPAAPNLAPESWRSLQFWLSEFSLHAKYLVPELPINSAW